MRSAFFCFLLLFHLFNLSLSLFTNLLDTLDHKPCEEVRCIGEEDGQYKEQGNVEERAEDADLVDDGDTYVLDEADVAMVEVVEIYLERVGEDRRDGYVDCEEYRDDLEVALGAQIVKLQRDGEHKVEHHKVVEEYGVKVVV